MASVFAQEGPYPGRILPWGFFAEYDVEDAHRISIGVSFNEGYDVAKFYQVNLDFFFELKGPNDDDYVLLPTKKTALRQLLMAPGIYAYAVGSFFQQGELPIGEYSLKTYDKLFGETYFYMEIIFFIVPCGH